MLFLGEQFEPEMLEYYKEPKRYFSTYSKGRFPTQHDQLRNWQINQPIFDRRARWHEEMTDEERKLFKEIAGPKLIEYGYESDQNW
jgi:hypothetical protein